MLFRSAAANAYPGGWITSRGGVTSAPQKIPMLILGAVQTLAPAAYIGATYTGSVERSFEIDLIVFGAIFATSVFNILLKFFEGNYGQTTYALTFSDFVSGLFTSYYGYFFLVGFVYDIAAIVLTIIAPQPDPNASSADASSTDSVDASATTGLAEEFYW